MKNYHFEVQQVELKQRQSFFERILKKEVRYENQLISLEIKDNDQIVYFAVSKDFNLKQSWNKYQIKEDIIIHTGKGSQFSETIKIKEFIIRKNILYPLWKRLFLESEKEFFFLFFNSKWEYFEKEVEEGKYDYLFTYNKFKKLLQKHGKPTQVILNEIIEFRSEK